MKIKEILARLEEKYQKVRKLQDKTFKLRMNDSVNYERCMQQLARIDGLHAAITIMVTKEMIGNGNED